MSTGKNKFLTYYECECADGYTGDFNSYKKYTLVWHKWPLQGNGLQCFDANGTMAVSGDHIVDLTMTLTSKVRIMVRINKWKN